MARKVRSILFHCLRTLYLCYLTIYSIWWCTFVHLAENTKIIILGYAFCSKSVNYSRLNSQYNWVTVYDHILRNRIFTLTMHKIFTWAPKIMGKWLWVQFGFANFMFQILWAVGTELKVSIWGLHLNNCTRCTDGLLLILVNPFRCPQSELYILEQHYVLPKIDLVYYTLDHLVHWQLEGFGRLAWWA